MGKGELWHPANPKPLIVTKFDAHD